MPAEPVTNARASAPPGSSGRHLATSLTLRRFQGILARVEGESGLLGARMVVDGVPWDRLVALALDGSPENDPNLVDPRYVVLPGQTGPHVVEFQQALEVMGHPVEVSGTFDGATLDAYRAWLASPGRHRHATCTLFPVIAPPRKRASGAHPGVRVRPEEVSE